MMASVKPLTDDEIAQEILDSSSPIHSMSLDIYDTDESYALLTTTHEGVEMDVEEDITTLLNANIDSLPEELVETTHKPPETLDCSNLILLMTTDIHDTNDHSYCTILQSTPEDRGDVPMENNLQLETITELSNLQDDGAATTDLSTEILYLDNIITDVEVDDARDRVEFLYSSNEITDETTYDQPGSDDLVDKLFDASLDEDYIPSDNEVNSTDSEEIRDNIELDEIPTPNGQDNEGDDEAPPVLPELKRKRNNSKNWKKNLTKKLRMSGKAYTGYRRTREGKVFHDQDRKERKMGSPCQSKMCQKSKVRHCYGFSHEQRQAIFDNFWGGMNWDQRKVYLVNMVVKIPVKRRTTFVEGEDDRCKREYTLQYFLSVGDVKRQVCQKMFLQTLDLNKWTVRYWVSGDNNKGKESLKNHSSVGMVPQASVTRPSTAEKSKKPEAKTFAKTFLDSLAKLPSHYCRKSTTRLYLEPIFKTLSQVYSVYKECCLNKTVDRSSSLLLSRNIFEKMFKYMNLAVYQPKKDRCDVCIGHEVGNITDDVYNNHVNLKDEARAEKDADKNEGKSKKCYVYCSDVQAVKLCPMLNASALYYKTKLNIHNFTMYNMATKEVECFWFDETSAELVASVFASCVVETIKCNLRDEPKPVILWSDGCPYQNKNAVFSNALLHLSVEKQVVIEQKFLVKGHTQMECDSVHSTIETALKDKAIYLPSQYHQITEESRKKPFPYKSKFLTHKFFKDFSKKETLIYDSIRPGRGVGDATVYDIVAIRYNPTGKIETKLNFQSDYVELPRRPKQNTFVTEFPSLFKQKIPVKASKFKHLQELKCVIPDDCHAFYDNLPHL